ncbi:hypothetical protein [Aquimarina spongiae]|uniref:Uncharacterized protein n=1 Tax=Aquimarina spongiae TaxID=570521 RepID=A0A1M6CWS4_9FLAO|nr:hypothetical protein [Aquimarina spongiae]SHI65188.1 hypothetical protein SAMN04488508_102310 [Aquimarina spongiae]
MNIVEKERIVQKNVLQIFKENFDVAQTETEILDIKPENQFEHELTEHYYDAVLDIFLIDTAHKENITGKVKDTIKKVAELWTITMPYTIW